MSGVTMLDTSVFGALNRANTARQVAQDLLQLKASGEVLMIGNSAYQEILNTKNVTLRNTQIRQIYDFQVEIQPPSTMAERTGAIADDYINASVDKTGANYTPKRSPLELKDVRLASDVKVEMARLPKRDVKFFTVERMANNQKSITNAYGIKFSERSRVLNNMGDQIPYNPESLGVKPVKEMPRSPPRGGASGNGPNNAAAKAGAKPTTNVPVRPGSGTSIHTAPSKMKLRFTAAKSAFKTGFVGAFSAANLASMIPDLILAIADKAAVRDAMRNIQTKFLKEGFGKGVAAALMGMSQDEVDQELKNRVTNYRVQGMGDAGGQLKLTYMLALAENCENYGVDIGYYWASIQPEEWRQKLLAEGMSILAKQNYVFNERELFEYRFINTLAYVIRHKTDAIVGPAIKFN